MTVLVFSLAAATAIQINDGTGTWYNIAPGTLTFVLDPSFTDPVTGDLTTTGDPFVQWTDVGGQAYAAPFRAVVNFKFPGPIGGHAGGL